MTVIHSAFELSRKSNHLTKGKVTFLSASTTNDRIMSILVLHLLACNQFIKQYNKSYIIHSVTNAILQGPIHFPKNCLSSLGVIWRADLLVCF